MEKNSEKNMDWLEKLRAIKNDERATITGIAQKSGIPRTTVEKIFGGRTKDPKIGTMTRILKAMGHELSDILDLKKTDGQIVYRDDLSDSERDIISMLREMNAESQKFISNVILREYTHIKALEYASGRRIHSVLYYDFPVSAGTGEYLDDSTVKIARLELEPPHGTDYILRIAGNSMEPEFSNGDHVYVQKTNSVEYGEIGIFVLAGSVYMKQYTQKGLKSLNPSYPVISGDYDIMCLGRVLGKVRGLMKT